MTRTAVILGVFAAALISMFTALPAHAQRVFVSGSGSDANPCTFPQPCRTFQQAYNTVAANGEIDVLDPAGYGPLAITKPISIQAHGFGGITASSGANAITVNVSTTVYADGANVNLNGLLIDGAGVGAEGIMATAAQSVTIANCVVRNFAHNGIEVTGVQYLAVVNTIASDNGYDGGAYSGIYIHNSSTSTMATITGATATGNGFNGIVAEGKDVSATIFSSNASNNINIGIFAQSNANVMVRESVASNNYIGFAAEMSGQLTLAHSVASGNGYGIDLAGGTGNTYQDNHVFGNTNPIIGGTLTDLTAY